MPFVISNFSRTILIGFLTLTLSQCFGPHREETHTRIFQEPTPKAFAGRYHLVHQRMDRALSEEKLFSQSFLTLRTDGTYTADNYPLFVRLPRKGFKFQRVAPYKGSWHIFKSGSAFNDDTNSRQEYWSFELDPVPGGSRRANGSEDLIVDAILSKASGQVEFIHFYTGDTDTGDVLSYERVR